MNSHKNQSYKTPLYQKLLLILQAIVFIIINYSQMNLVFTPIKQQNRFQYDSPKSETSTCALSESDHEDRQKHFIFENQQKNVWNQAELKEKNMNVKLKNQLCKNFLRMGFCPYNQKCQFAHGTNELRQKTDHNLRYKTKKCNSFFNTGYCIYGERCNFMHKNEVKNTEAKWKVIKKYYRGLLQEVKTSSRFFPITIQQN